MLATRRLSILRVPDHTRLTKFSARALRPCLLGVALSLLQILAVAQDPAPWSRLYVTDFASNTVSVVDLRTSRLLTVIPVGFGPTGIAVTPDRQRVYVANYWSGTVSVISTGSNLVEKTIEIPSGYGRSAPFAVVVTPDGGKAYVTSAADGAIVVLETATNTVSKRITDAYDWALRSLAISPDGGYLYAVGAGDGKISVIDTSTDKAVAKITNVPNPYHLAFTPDGARAYVTSEKLSRVYVIDTTTYRLIDTIQFPPGSGTITIDIVQTGKLAYVANFFNKISAIDLDPRSPTYHKVVGEVPPNSFYQYCIIVAPDGRFAYLSNQSDRGKSPNSINVIDIAPDSPTRHTIVGSIPVGKQPWGVAAVNEPNAEPTPSRAP